MNGRNPGDGEPDGQLWRPSLSALSDGEATAAEGAQACAAWAQDAELRRTWHAYALIGDVLRSEDLASDGAHDAAFLTRFRAQLAAEPVVLAPQALAESAQWRPSRMDPEAVVARRRGRFWSGSMAVAAGVLTVVGVTAVWRGPAEGPAAQLASASAPVAPVSVAAPQGAGVVTVVRNPDIDRYLAAHRQYAQSPVLSTPGGLRQVVATPAER